MLKRELSKFQSYATLIGTMIGAGIFVAIGEAGQFSGPATFLAYLILGPVTILTCLPYIVFHSTPLGNLPGGAYMHISRTFKSYFPAFITMWLTWITYLGVLSVLSISVGKYLHPFFPNTDPRFIASICLFSFYAINIFGVKNYGRVQSTLFIILVAALVVIIGPGLFAIKMANFQPFLPKGWSGFFQSLTILFFAYAGFDALAQTAGETKSARTTLPKIFAIGIGISVLTYVLISLVSFGSLPYSELIASHRPVADAAAHFLPYGSHIVAVGALAAFLTTINACMLVPSRILYVFAEDRVAPRLLAKLNRRFETPHISLTANVIISIALVWTQTVGYLISISMQSLLILYAMECLALAFLPYANKTLWSQVPYKIKPIWAALAGGLAFVCQVVLYTLIPNPISAPLVIWFVAGAGLYIFTRYRGKKEGFNYKVNLSLPNQDVPETISSESDLVTS